MNKLRPVLASHEKCTGCSVCADVCPKQTITMRRDLEGFLYPFVGADCIGCHLCEKTCPVISPVKIERSLGEQIACGAIHKDKKIWRNSSSGGAFVAICQVFCDENTIIYGAMYDKEKRYVHHNYVVGLKNISLLQGSKYVQSDMHHIMKSVYSFIKKGRKVLFSGVPCQIAALRKYLERLPYDSSKLLCVDLVCHGVGSPKVFREYIKFCERQNDSSVVDFKFRKKFIKVGIQKLYPVEISFTDGYKIKNYNDTYVSLFLKKIICRPSCDNCLYANLQRTGDITIADFKQLYSVIKSAPANRNASAIIVNTAMGLNVYHALDKYMDIYTCDIKDIQMHNTPLYKCVKSPDLRTEFFADFVSQECINTLLLNKYRTKRHLQNVISANMPAKFKAYIKRLLGRFK